MQAFDVYQRRGRATLASACTARGSIDTFLDLL